MTESPLHRFAPDSLNCAAALRNRLLMSSAGAGWTSCVLDHVEGDLATDVHETHATPDLTVVVATRGEHDVEIFSAGRWRQAIYQVGATGITTPKETTRLRWRNRNPGSPFRTAHLYVPASMLIEAAELCRRPGQALSADIAHTLVVNEPATATVISSLLGALQDGAPDIYADVTLRWLAMHLVYRFHARLRGDEEDGRLEFLSDRRLARAIEFMTANLARPIGVDDIAREACVSPFHFTRLFRQKLGVAPHRYLTSRRMEKAQRLLSTTDLPVATVGTECGYPLASSFTAAFTRYFGVAPLKWAALSRADQA
jgi:AraC family transcriptional regulator